MNSSHYWDLCGWLAAVAITAWLSERLFERRAPVAFLTLAGIYFAIGLGLAQSLAAVIFFTSCCALGLLAISVTGLRRGVNSGATSLFFIGLCLYLALFSILSHYPINYRSVYIVILLLPIFAVLLLPSLSPTLKNFRERFRVEERQLNRIPFLWFVGFAAVIGYVLRFSFFPSFGFDDNVYHLRLWTELVYRHVYTFDVVEHVFEAAPFAVDLIHSIVSITAGGDARGAINVMFFLLAARQLSLVMRTLRLSPPDRLAAVALFATTPMLALLLVSLQSELFLALAATAGARLTLDMRAKRDPTGVLALLAIAAAAVAAKLTGIVIACFMLAAAFAVVWRTRPAVGPFLSYRNTAGIAVLTLCFALAAAHSYANSYYLTGNPFFPFYNGFFKSEFFQPVNFVDARWSKGFSLASYINVFFNTSQYYESKNYCAGFQYLFLLPVGLACLLGRCAPAITILIVVPLMGFGGLMFYQTQYWRYIFPILPLASAAIGTLLTNKFYFGTRALSDIGRRAVICCMALNMFFMPGISGTFRAAPQEGYTAAGKQHLLERFAPAAAVTVRLNEIAPGQNILYPGTNPYGARLFGRPVYINWYSPRQSAQMASVRNADDMARFLKTQGIKYVVWEIAEDNKAPLPMRLLREHLTKYAVPEIQIGSVIAYQIFDSEDAKLSAPGFIHPTGLETLPSVRKKQPHGPVETPSPARPRPGGKSIP